MKFITERIEVEIINPCESGQVCVMELHQGKKIVLAVNFRSSDSYNDFTFLDQYGVKHYLKLNDGTIQIPEPF